MLDRGGKTDGFGLPAVAFIPVGFQEFRGVLVLLELLDPFCDGLGLLTVEGERLDLREGFEFGFVLLELSFDLLLVVYDSSLEFGLEFLVSVVVVLLVLDVIGLGDLFDGCAVVEVVEDLLQGGGDSCLPVDTLVDTLEYLGLRLLFDVVGVELIRILPELFGEDGVEEHLGCHFPLDQGGLPVFEDLFRVLLPQLHEGFDPLLLGLLRLLVLLPV